MNQNQPTKRTSVSQQQGAGAMQPARTTGAVAQRTAQPRKIKRIRLAGQVDRPFLILVVLLVCFGSVMIFSTGYVYAETKKLDSFYFARQQCIYALSGIVIMMIVSSSKVGDYIFLKRVATIMFFIAIVLNVAPLIPGIGKTVNGARRWINLRVVEFQPSEILKFALILLYARFCSNNGEGMRNFKKGVLPLLALLFVSILPVLLIQRHLSCTIILVGITFAMMWLGGVRGKWLVSSGVLGGAVAGFALMSNVLAHSIGRLRVWRNPFDYLRDGGWQPAQSLYAISAGGFFGLGLGQSNQKHGYLPEPHNDYIFAILCEELGYLGAIVVIGLFIALVWRGMYIAKRAEDPFATMMVGGIMCSLAMHVVLNIAVVTNSLPSTGIGLPFFSYGGTSLWIWLAEMGVVLSASRYSYLERE